MTSIFTVERTWNETLIEQTRRHVNFTLATERKKHKEVSKKQYRITRITTYIHTIYSTPSSNCPLSPSNGKINKHYQKILHISNKKLENEPSASSNNAPNKTLVIEEKHVDTKKFNVSFPSLHGKANMQ